MRKNFGFQGQTTLEVKAGFIMEGCLFYREASVAPIYTMAVVKGQIIFSKKFSSTIEIWDIHKDRKQRSFNVEDVFR